MSHRCCFFSIYLFRSNCNQYKLFSKGDIENFICLPSFNRRVKYAIWCDSLFSILPIIFFDSLCLIFKRKKHEKQCTILFGIIWCDSLRSHSRMTEIKKWNAVISQIENWILKKWISNKMQVSVKNVECSERRFLFSILWYLFWRVLLTEKEREKEKVSLAISTPSGVDRMILFVCTCIVILNDLSNRANAIGETILSDSYWNIS